MTGHPYCSVTNCAQMTFEGAMLDSYYLKSKSLLPLQSPLSPAQAAREASKMPDPKFDTQPEAQLANEGAWAEFYRDADRYCILYELGKKLADDLRCCRINHVTAAEHVIGFKRGSNGTSGLRYLGQMLNMEFVPELWSV